jgi:hypothetical protein
MNASLADEFLLDASGNKIEIITVVNRIRVLFTSTSVWMCVFGGLAILIITLIASTIVTLKSRK